MAVHVETVEVRVPEVDGGGYRKIKPLRGHVLVRLLPLEYTSHGGLVLPDIALFNERGEKQRPRKAIVIAIGTWRTTRDGRFSILPDIAPGQRVLVSEYFGTKVTRGIGEELRLCNIDDVLAVLEEELTPPPPKA